MAPIDEIKTENTIETGESGSDQDLLNLQKETIDKNLESLSDKTKPTKEEIKQERKDLRLERKEDRQLNRLILGLNREIAKTSESKQILNKTTAENALLMMNLDELRRFNDYLMKVRSGDIDPATEQFEPKNLKSFLSLLAQMPHGRGYIDFVKKSDKGTTDTRVVDLNPTSVTYTNGNRTVNTGNNLLGNLDVSNTANPLEAFKEKGVRGALKRSFDYLPNMTENQKNGWTNALFLGAMGYGIFKLGKRFFTGAKDKDGKQIGPGFLGRLGIIGGVFLGTNMLTGKSPIDIIQKALNGGLSREYLKGQWGAAANNASETAKERVVYPLDVTRLFGKTKIAELGLVLNDDFKIKNYDVLVQKTQAEKDQDSLDLLQKIGKEDKDNQIRKGLEAMGITPDNYKNFGDKTVDEIYELYNKNILKAETFIKENNLILDTENKDKNKKYKDLISSGVEITDADLQKLVEEGVLYEQFDIKKDSNREQLKEKVNNLENGKTLRITLKGEKSEIFKSADSEIGLKSKNGKITIINLDNVTIKGLGTSTGVDRRFSDADGNNNYYELFTTADLLNKLKNKYEGRIYASGSLPFLFNESDGKIHFIESKEGGGIINDDVIDDGVMGFFSQFPDSFKGQEKMIVNYLNKEVKVSSEKIEDVVKYFNDRNMDVKLTNNNTTLESHGESIKIDLTTRKIEGLDRQFQNYLDLVGAANLINAFKQILKQRQAQSKNPVYSGLDGDIAFNDRTIFEEMKTYLNKGPQGYGDTDIVKSGNITFRKENTLESVSPTLYKNRKEFVNYLNKVSGFKEYVPVDKEAIELQKIKNKISEALNFGMDPKIDISASYDKNKKTLKLEGIDEKIIQNDQLLKNLKNVTNQVSWYNIFQSEYVEKIQLPKVDMKPGEFVSLKYLSQLMKLDETKFELGANILANKKMVKFVIKEYDEGKFQKEENSNIDMNGVIILNYIYHIGYDFNRLFNGEDDSRIDFAMRTMELLAGHKTVVDATKKTTVQLDKSKVKTPIELPAGDDPIMKIRRVGKGENVDFGFSQNRQWRKNKDNIDIMNKMIKNINRYVENPIENVPYITKN